MRLWIGNIEPGTDDETLRTFVTKYAKGVTLPGFRTGMAPVEQVRLRYKEDIQNEVLRTLLPDKIEEAIRTLDLHPLSEPQVHVENYDNLKVNGSEPLRIHVHVEVMPEIPSPEYKGLEAVRRVRPLRDGELEGIIEERRQGHSTLIPVEGRKSEEGDTVLVDLEGTFADDPNAEPIRAEDLEITLGDEMIEKSFSENLLGVQEDDEKEFTVSYPDDFSSPALAGKTVTYKAKVKSLGTVELPEADDDWAQSLDEGFASMAELREKLGRDLEAVAKADADARVRTELINSLIEKHDFEIPPTLIEAQARNLLNNFAQDLAGRGVDLNKVEKEFVQMAYNQMRSQAEKDVRGAMLLERIAEMEKIEISDEEVNEELMRIAEHYRVSPDEVRASLAQQGGDANIVNNLRTRKAVEAIVNHAKISDEEWVDENQKAAAADESAETEAKSKPAKGKKAAEGKKAEEGKTAKKPAKKEKSA